MGNTHLQALNELIAALQDQTAAIQSLVLSTTVNPTINVKCGGGCGCGGGSEPPSEPGIEGDPPPTGWEPPTDDTGTEIVPGQPAYQSRKCKVANALHAQIQITVGKMKQTNFWGIPLETLVSLFGDAYLVVVSTALGYIIGEMIVPVFPFLDGIAGSTVGFIYSVVDAIIGEDVDLDDLDLKLNDPLLQEDLVCALYNADGSVSAAVNYVSVLNDAGVVNVKTQGVILALFVPDILNNLFYTYTDYSDQIEAALDGYTGPVDCACGQDLTYLHSYCGVVQGVYVSGDFNTQIVIDSVGTQSVCTGPVWQFIGISPTVPGVCLHFEFNVLSGAVAGISYLDCAGVHQDYAPGVTGIDSTSVHLYNNNNQPFRVEITVSTTP